MICWLSTRRFVNYNDKSGLASDKPSEFVLKKAFSTFGEVRIVDIPMLDPYRSWITIFLYSINHLLFHRHKMKKGVAGIKTFSFGQDLVFDAFIQFKVNSLITFSKINVVQIFQEYIGFVKCMNAMKGMKLCYKDRDSEKAWTSNIKVGWNWWIVPFAKCDISVSRLLPIFEDRGFGFNKNGICNDIRNSVVVYI